LVSAGLYVLIKGDGHYYLEVSGSSSIPKEINSPKSSVTINIKFSTLNVIKGLNTQAHLIDPTAIAVGPQFDKEAFKREVLGAVSTIAAINSVGLGYLHSLSPFVVLKDMYTKLAQFGGFIFLVISCTKMIGMVYMFMTTGRFFLHHSLIYCTQIKEKKWVPYKSSLRATSSKPLNLFRLARKRVFYWHSQPDTCLPK
jgi:hypothetical protein